MIERQSYSFIIIGLALRALRSIGSEDQKKYFISTLSKLDNALEAVGFEVSLVALRTSTPINELKAALKEHKEDDDIGLAFRSLSNEMLTLERTVYAEAVTRNIYMFQENRFNNNYLLREPSRLLAKGTFGKLSDLAQFDFSSACRCILKDEGTACAFHILRTTENVLREYYFHYKKSNRLRKPMWGPMTTELRAKRSNKPSERILDQLDNVRVSYRNPTQHPDVRYDGSSAQDLFSVCVNLINEMIAAIHK